MKPKNLQEFIENKARPMYQTLEDGSGVQLRQSFALEALAEITAKHLLDVAREWSNDRNRSANEYEGMDCLINFLESYCAPVEDVIKFENGSEIQLNECGEGEFKGIKD